MHMQENTTNKHDYARKSRNYIVFTSFFCIAKSSKIMRKHEPGGVARRTVSESGATAERTVSEGRRQWRGRWLIFIRINKD